MSFFSLPQQPHLPTAPSLSEGNRCLIYKSAKFPPFSSWSVVCMLYLICNRYLISCHTRIALFHFTICRGREFHTWVLFLTLLQYEKAAIDIFLLHTLVYKRRQNSDALLYLIFFYIISYVFPVPLSFLYSSYSFSIQASFLHSSYSFSIQKLF